MIGIDERVKNFLESWTKIQADSILSMGSLRCVVCDRKLEDGGFALLYGDPVCHKCREKLKGE